jgi:hypothetical protein
VLKKIPTCLGTGVRINLISAGQVDLGIDLKEVRGVFDSYF